MWVCPALGQTVRKPYAGLGASLLHILAQTWGFQSFSHLKILCRVTFVLNFILLDHQLIVFRCFSVVWHFLLFPFFLYFLYLQYCVFKRHTVSTRGFYCCVHPLKWSFRSVWITSFYYLSSIFGNIESLYLGKSKSYNFIYGFWFIYCVKQIFPLRPSKSFGSLHFCLWYPCKFIYV